MLASYWLLVREFQAPLDAYFHAPMWSACYTKGDFAAQQQISPFPGVFPTLFGALWPVLFLTL